MDLDRASARKANAKLSAVNALKSVPQLHQPRIALEIEVVPHGSFFVNLNLVVVPENPLHLLFEVMSQICYP